MNDYIVTLPSIPLVKSGKLSIANSPTSASPSKRVTEMVNRWITLLHAEYCSDPMDSHYARIASGVEWELIFLLLDMR